MSQVLDNTEKVFVRLSSKYVLIYYPKRSLAMTYPEGLLYRYTGIGVEKRIYTFIYSDVFYHRLCFFLLIHLFPMHPFSAPWKHHHGLKLSEIYFQVKKKNTLSIVKYKNM